MGKKLTSTRQVLNAHSKAKVELYIKYLSTYLSILGNTPYTKHVHLFDVLCGEGRYADDSEGSALKSLKAILEYQKDVPNSTLELSVRLNDSGQSDIEPKIKKIERVERYAAGTLQLLKRTNAIFSSKDYQAILGEVNCTLNKLKVGEKALVFIDPWGYKSIQPKEIAKLLAGGSTEVLLFLPVAHMQRFANAAVAPLDFSEEVMTCMKPLKALLEELFDNQVPYFPSFNAFAKDLHEQLKQKLCARYAANFILESADRNKYAIFFYTSNLKGLEVFVQSCWKIDPETGRGHFVKKVASGLLFPPEEFHAGTILKFVQSRLITTNHDLYEFGLLNYKLTTITNKALNILRGRGQVVASLLNGSPSPKNANYLGYKHEKTIYFKSLI